MMDLTFQKRNDSDLASNRSSMGCGSSVGAREQIELSIAVSNPAIGGESQLASKSNMESSQSQSKRDENRQGSVAPPTTTISEEFLETGPSALRQTLRKQLDSGFDRRNIPFVESVFKKFCAVDGSNSISHLEKENLLPALREVDAYIESGEGCTNSSTLLRTLDRNSDGIVDLEEFTKAAQKPWPLETWVRSFPLHQMLVDCLPRTNDSDYLRFACNLSDNDMKEAVGLFGIGLLRILTENVQKVKELFVAKDDKDSRMGDLATRDPTAKFQVDVHPTSWGKIKHFHEGLASRIGHAHLDFGRAMETEHCAGPGSTLEFTSKNYGITTNPSKEWKIVLGTMECPQEDRGHGRRIPKVDELLRLKEANEAKLKDVEVIALVLYTGPMYQLYNTVLRRFPQANYNELKDKECHFTVTISVLVSAVQKISRVTVMKPDTLLYRGLSADLPSHFAQCDEHGCTGFTEWAFMSTSTDKEVAVRYAVQGGTHPHPRVLVIPVGSVDRGACIQEFSQYKQEKEYLFVPCSFVEQTGEMSMEVTDKGVLEMIPVRVNANLKAMTLEERVEEKKNMHVAAFEHLIREIENELTELAKQGGAKERLEKDESKDATHTVEGFLKRIVEQCKDVLSKHKAASTSDFVRDRVFRSLVREMIEVKIMAISKLREWLENECSSFIRFRWNAKLRTAHRRWIAFLEKKLLVCEDLERKSVSLKLCQTLGLLVDSVEEKNELDETCLMRAAAEGRPMKTLKLLVEAGALVNAARPDGVTPVWLAAQFGHDWTLRSLAELKASVTQAANDGATPVYIAAQNGNARCIQVLVELNADVQQKDNFGTGPMHQAAMNGHVDCIDMLAKLGVDIVEQNQSGQSPLDLAQRNRHDLCANHIQGLLPNQKHLSVESISLSSSKSKRKLIISSGDISDVDGFFALAEYAKTGADVVFVMNYPAYTSVKEAEYDPKWAEENPGLGYKYGAKQVLDRDASTAPESYSRFMSKCKTSAETEDNGVMKQALTDLAFAMVTKIWKEAKVSNSRSRLYFCIGGVNAINPFSETAIKNEVLIFADLLSDEVASLPTEQGTVYDEAGNAVEFLPSEYKDIYMDFNGSLAFWDESWANKMSQSSTVGKIRGVFVMGGVLTDREPVTMASIPNVLNRFSSATMNQLYHPQNAADFFAFLEQYQVSTFVVTNNVVSDLTTFADDERKQKTNQGVETFLVANQLNGQYLRQAALAYYSSTHSGARKPFDFYAAYALRKYMEEGSKPAQDRSQSDTCNRMKCSKKNAYYSNVYGITCVSSLDTWDTARAEYISSVSRSFAHAGDNARENTRINLFRAEVEQMKAIDRASSLAVYELHFHLDGKSMLLELVDERDERI